MRVVKEGHKGVTDILEAIQEPEIIAWKLKNGEKKCKAIIDEALAIGTIVDQLIRQDIKGDGYSLEGQRPEVVSCMRAWEKFKVKYPKYVSQVEDIQTELTQDGIVGHPDIVHLNEINDIKSGNYLSLRPKYVVQASKYAVMRGKNRAAILLLSKKSEQFLYIWWEGDLVTYYGVTVFDAYRLVMTYQDGVKDMTRKFLEKEFENAV